jgi:hypothetical protein
MAHINFEIKEVGTTWKSLRVTQNFIDFYDLGFGSNTLKEFYEEPTVFDLALWLTSRQTSFVIQHSGTKLLKFQEKALYELENKVMPYLKEINKELIIEIEEN